MSGNRQKTVFDDTTIITPFGNGGDESGFSAAREAYFSAVKAFQQVCNQLTSAGKVDGNELKAAVDVVISVLKQDERMLLGLANAPYSYVIRFLEENIHDLIVIHGINVMIYSMKISNDLGVPEKRMPYIGMASLFHNLGLLDAPQEVIDEFLDGTNSIEKIREFERQSDEYVRKINIEGFHAESVELLLTLIKEDREALSRTSLREAMYQYAMIIHICNIFERLTHQKTYGDILSPVDAMKKMRDEMKDFFHPDIIKLFFNRLSIYPLGSFVKLSSLETAKIVGINDNFIMRPVVFIVLDDEGREKIQPVKINLREKPNIYIKKAVVDEKLTEQYIDLF